MLNERAEFEAYITNPESSSPRIQPKLLTGNFSTDCGLYGIEQILVVLARGYIFDTYREDEIYSDGFVRPELLSDAKLFLQRWLGFHFDHADSPESNPTSRRQTSNGTDYFREADDGLKNIGWHIVRKPRRKKKIFGRNWRPNGPGNFVRQRLSGKSNNIEFRNCPGTQSWVIKRTVFGLSERSFRHSCEK